MRPLWKVTYRMGSFSSIVCGHWNEWQRVYRWRWLANAGRIVFHLPMMPGLMRQTEIEQYWPNSNVVPLRRAG